VTALDPERIALEPHPGYHGTPPRLTHVELHYFSDRGAAVAAVAAGRVDGLGHLRADEIDRLTRSSGVVVYSVPERSKVATLSLNVQTPLFQDKAIRLALGMAIDRDGLVTRALGGQAEPAFGPIPVQSWAYARAPGARQLDPNGAAALLEQAGWAMGTGGVREREGQPLTFTLLTADTPDRLAVARDLASQLAGVGFGVRVSPLPADELAENHLEPRQFEAALVGQWTMGSDPDVYPQWHSSQATQIGGNYAGFSDPDIDRWLEVGRQQIGQEERRNAYGHFQARWAEELPSVVLYHPLYSFAVSRDIWGVRADPVPDSSWRLRDAVSWHRVARPTALQRARAAVLAFLPSVVRDRLS
jgi:peptide/nickel transport system substrate-binding protein